MESGRLLPLFPLSTVLFPGISLPLHIFEDRYKLMVRRCRETDGIMGIVSIRKGEEVGVTAEPNEIGTLARITRIDALSEGKINLTVVGERRFRISELNRDEPYLRGRVDVIPDDVSTLSRDVVAEIRQWYVEYIRTLRRLSQRSERHVRVPEGSIELSYAIAAHLQVSRAEQQTLLEAGPDGRLIREREILRRELALLQRLGAVSSRRTRSSHDVSLN